MAASELLQDRSICGVFPACTGNLSKRSKEGTGKKVKSIKGSLAHLMSEGWPMRQATVSQIAKKFAPNLPIAPLMFHARLLPMNQKKQQFTG